MPVAKPPGRFRKRTELLDFLLEVSEVTLQTLDLDRLLESVSRIVTQVVECEFLAILLYSERRQALRVRYTIGHRAEIVDRLVLGLDEGITGAAATLREPVLVGDVRTDPRYLKAIDAVRTELAVPMLARQKLVGVLDMQSTRLNAYNEQDRSLLQLIASRVAFAIDNARLYRRVERHSRTMGLLALWSREFSSILDLDELLKKIAASVRGLIQFDAFSIYLVEEEAGVLRNRFSIRYDRQVDLDSIPLGKGITGAAAESRSPIRVRDTRQDPRYITSHSGILSEVAIPLIVRDRVLGVMDLESDRVGFFTEAHVQTLSLLAPQIASSVENARLYSELAIRERRMEVDIGAAKELQLLLLPPVAPEVRGLDIGIGLRPAREISGDLYDFVIHSDEQMGLAFGDVSGKGVAAALFGAVVAGLLRSLARRRKNPAGLLKALNDALIQRKVEARYVALLVALWNADSGELEIANGGTLPPLVVRDGSPVELRPAGVPLGLLPDREYEQVTFKTQPGDIIVLFSDGVLDQSNSRGEEYSLERLVSLVAKSPRRRAQKIVNSILADLVKFGEGEPVVDDQTLVVLKVRSVAS